VCFVPSFYTTGEEVQTYPTWVSPVGSGVTHDIVLDMNIYIYIYVYDLVRFDTKILIFLQEMDCSGGCKVNRPYK
jgi:hypothetical protein